MIPEHSSVAWIDLGAVHVPARGVTGTSWSEEISGYGTESVPLPREPASCEGGCP